MHSRYQLPGPAHVTCTRDSSLRQGTHANTLRANLIVIELLLFFRSHVEAFETPMGFRGFSRLMRLVCVCVSFGFRTLGSTCFYRPR